jgi:hypothetical protein
MLNRSNYAVNQRRYRARQRKPLRRVARVEVEYQPLIEALRYRQLIVNDKDEIEFADIETALSVVVQEWISGVIRR